MKEVSRLGMEEVSYSDRISQLPDDLLFRILSFIPASDAMSTSLLSKRWKSLWKMMPTLYLDEDSYFNIDSLPFYGFCLTYLRSHEAPVLTSLNLKPANYFNGLDSLLINTQSILLEITITSSSHRYDCSPIRFPRYLNNVYESLVVMKLQDNLLVEVYLQDSVCFRSLKSLHLTRVIYSHKDTFSTLLSACPVLEDLHLFINRVSSTCLSLFTISVPSLQRLSIRDKDPFFLFDKEPFFLFDKEPFFLFGKIDLGTRFEINTPSLKYLKIAGRHACFKFVEDMPKLVEAHVEANQDETKNMLRFLTSVERLSIYFFSSMVLNLTDIIFHRLLHLELHLYNRLQGNRILSLLKKSPNLQALKLNEEPVRIRKKLRSVIKPKCVPKCLNLHLETLEWRGYAGRPEDKEIAVYVLENARRLNTAKFSRHVSSSRYRYAHCREKDMRIVKELKSISKASTSCQLVIQCQNHP